MNSAPVPARPTILIVEDQDVMRAMLREFVQNAFPGCAIVDAANGQRATQLCAEHRPQVVLMDINLPDADGIALTARMIGMFPATRVIMVTQYAGNPYSDLARAAGVFGYVVKEKIYTNLLPLVASAMGGGRPDDQEGDPS